jgi:hypothetical protein
MPVEFSDAYQALNNLAARVLAQDPEQKLGDIAQTVRKPSEPAAEGAPKKKSQVA